MGGQMASLADDANVVGTFHHAVDPRICRHDWTIMNNRDARACLRCKYEISAIEWVEAGYPLDNFRTYAMPLSGVLTK
jgi:hypothetical protein